MLILIEGLVMCFLLLITCVIGIANGPVGLVVLYEEDVQERVVSLGLTTKERIKKSLVISSIAMFVPALVLAPVSGNYWLGFAAYSVFLLIPSVLHIKESVQWYISRSKI